jgi:hypothetical protein
MIVLTLPRESSNLSRESSNLSGVSTFFDFGKRNNNEAEGRKCDGRRWIADRRKNRRKRLPQPSIYYHLPKTAKMSQPRQVGVKYQTSRDVVRTLREANLKYDSAVGTLHIFVRIGLPPTTHGV